MSPFSTASNLAAGCRSPGVDCRHSSCRGLERFLDGHVRDGRPRPGDAVDGLGALTAGEVLHQVSARFIRPVMSVVSFRG